MTIAIPADGSASSQRNAALTLGALGVVYGDIGTSPLYTMREAFGEAGGLPLEQTAVLGVLSLVFWALIIVVTLKYVILMLRADNRGEGGILALSTLAVQGAGGRRRRNLVITLGLFGAALFYGDSLITPAISVLSAVEGLEVAAPGLKDYVVPVAIGILVALFLVQSRGTARVGRLFGPVMLVWFTVLGLLGLIQIVQQPGVLAALSPTYGVALFTTHGWVAFKALGAVVLAVTGAEALYADMGHFGRAPIRTAWFSLVLPGLVLNYFGQGALLLSDPTTVENPFYLLAPSWALYPMVILATLATVIASQAVISGAYSLTRQGMQLGSLPRLRVRHTSESRIGQVYVPKVNWILLLGVVLLVLNFQSSSNLAAAYGIAVIGAMTIDTILAFIVTRYLWRWSLALAIFVLGSFFIIDLGLLGANLLKIPSGGWFPLVLGLCAFLLMATWRRGRHVLYERRYRDMLPLEDFLKRITPDSPPRVAGTAIFMTGRPEFVPHALLHNLKHNKVLHQRVIVMTVMTEEVPRIAELDRLTIDDLGHNFHRIVVRYGFAEQPDIRRALAVCKMRGLDFNLMETSFFLNRETFVPSVRPEMSPWREKIFIAMTRHAVDATEFFNVPPNRVVELGTQIEI